MTMEKSIQSILRMIRHGLREIDFHGQGLELTTTRILAH
jgi:hypothetical protein